MINGAKAYGVKSLGIYTNYNSWAAIVGPNWTGGSDLLLWWPRWNGNADVTTGWSPFGGWTKVAIHQYSGDVNSQCALDIDQDYKP
uniref:Lysozyme n=1 Tax=Acrobeloides nanus TaxID=290746 RepID=A0A914EK14_9BILA